MVVGQDRNRQPIGIGNGEKVEPELQNRVDAPLRDPVQHMVGQRSPCAAQAGLEIDPVLNAEVIGREGDGASPAVADAQQVEKIIEAVPQQLSRHRRVVADEQIELVLPRD